MSTSAFQASRVLIVEDEAITALDLSTELTALGYDVCGVVDTEDEAVEAAIRDRPALVLMDVRLADGGDGIETARRIGARHDAAIVFLTAHSDEQTLTRALEVSPFGYLIKPFRARDLKVAIELALAKHARDSAAARDLRALAATDVLTGLPNRRAIDSILRAEWTRCRGEGLSLAVLMADIDHFKALNDVGGHLAGDTCLRTVAGIIERTCAGAGAVLGRWGGEEFLAILSPADLDRGCEVGKRIVAAVREAGLPHPAAAAPGIVTVSVGVAAGTPSTSSPEYLLGLADRGLYRAKYAGRDQMATERRGLLP